MSIDSFWVGVSITAWVFVILLIAGFIYVLVVEDKEAGWPFLKFMGGIVGVILVFLLIGGLIGLFVGSLL